MSGWGTANIRQARPVPTFPSNTFFLPLLRIDFSSGLADTIEDSSDPRSARRRPSVPQAKAEPLPLILRGPARAHDIVISSTTKGSSFVCPCWIQRIVYFVIHDIAIRPVTPSMFSALAMEPVEEISQLYAPHRILFLARLWYGIGGPRAWIEKRASLAILPVH